MIERLSIAQASTPGASLGQDLIDYVEAGAGGIGMAEDKLVAGGEPDALARFIESGLKATLSTPAVPSLLPTPTHPLPCDPAERTAAISSSVRRLTIFDPVAVAIAVGPLGDDEVRDVAVSGLRQVARVAADQHPRGVQLALRCGGAELSIDAALEIARDAGEPSIGVSLDGRSCAAPGFVERAVANVDQIACVELHGITSGIGLEILVAALHEAGYRGYYELALPPDGADSDPAGRLGAAVVAFRVTYESALGRPDGVGVSSR